MKTHAHQLYIILRACVVLLYEVCWQYPQPKVTDKCCHIFYNFNIYIATSFSEIYKV